MECGPCRRLLGRSGWRSRLLAGDVFGSVRCSEIWDACGGDSFNQRKLYFQVQGPAVRYAIAGYTRSQLTRDCVYAPQGRDQSRLLQKVKESSFLCYCEAWDHNEICSSRPAIAVLDSSNIRIHTRPLDSVSHNTPPLQGSRQVPGTFRPRPRRPPCPHIHRCRHSHLRRLRT